MLVHATRRYDPATLLESFVPLLGAETWDDLVVGLLRATRVWLEADEARFWQVDASAGGLRARWSATSQGVREDSPGRVRPFVQPLDEESNPSPTNLSSGSQGWTLEVSCRARGGELGLLEIRGSGTPPDSQTVSQWACLSGGALVQGREALRERLQAGGIRKLSGIARELSAIDDSRFFWQRVVEIARDAFGVERCAAYLAGSDPSILQGSWGTDFDGRTIGEWGLEIPVDILESRAGRPLYQVRSWALLADDLPRCGAGVETTHGTVPHPAVLTPVPGLPEGSCWLLTDSVLTGGSLEPAVNDLLESYAALVGQIAGRLRAERALEEFLIDDIGSDPGPDQNDSPVRLAEILEQMDSSNPTA